MPPSASTRTELDDLPIPMLRAAADGDVEALRRILTEGINGKPCRPDASNVIGQSSLHFAAMWGHADAVEALLDAGANVNIKNDEGITPLFFAVRKCHEDVVEVLLLGGAKITRLPLLLQLAETTPGPQGKAIAEMLRVHAQSGNELTQAIKSLDLDRLQSLLDVGRLAESESWEDPFGSTPLTHAVKAVVAIVEQRVEQDVDDPFGPSDGLTALEMLVHAAEACGEGAVREACAELDTDGNGPLHHLAQAGYAGHPAALALLLRAGADANVQSTPVDSEYTSGQWGRKKADGTLEVLRGAPDRTPLHMALESGEPSETMVKLLLEHKADPNLRDNEQRTALHLALDFEEERGGIDLPMCELLLRHRADPMLGSHEIGMANSCLHAAAIFNEVEVVRVLLRHGAPHSAAGKGGWTPLAIAARGGGAGVVAALLAAGADPDAPSPTGKTVRELAAVNKKAEVIKALEGATELD